MSSVVIPKEQLTAFQRWELAAFDRPSGIPQRTPEEIELATVAELERIRQQAYEEGFEQGKAEGYASGVAQAAQEATQLHTLAENLELALNHVDADVAQALLDLSLEIACKMTSTALQVKPEIILSIVNQAIGKLPYFNQHAHLTLHPEDATLVRRHLGEHLTQTGWKLLTDPRIERGGCRIDTAHTTIDATVAARWKHIVETIGADRSWLP